MKKEDKIAALMRKEKLERNKKIKSLPTGSSVICLSGELSGRIVEIVRHNPKTTTVKYGKELWYYPRYQLGFPNDEKDKQRAEGNRQFRLLLGAKVK